MLNKPTLKPNKMKKPTLTELELKVLEIIGYGDEYEETPTECFDNIMDSFDGTKNQLKGILGSLEKKNCISIGEYPNGLNAYHGIIFNRIRTHLNK